MVITEKYMPEVRSSVGIVKSEINFLEGNGAHNTEGPQLPLFGADFLHWRFLLFERVPFVNEQGTCIS